VDAGVDGDCRAQFRASSKRKSVEEARNFIDEPAMTAQEWPRRLQWGGDAG